jgi:outer membrane lipoprotein SlyB
LCIAESLRQVANLTAPARQLHAEVDALAARLSPFAQTVKIRTQGVAVMENASTLERPIRVGVFSTIRAADCAVENLLNAGFTSDQITVVCSDRVKEEHFRRFEHEEPAGSHTAAAVGVGGAIGAALGGLTVLAGAVTTAGLGLLAAGGLAAWTGGVVGGLVGAMMTRGVEHELANYYDQAVTAGRILVATEDHSEGQRQRLARAEQILSECGAEPIALREG